MLIAKPRVGFTVSVTDIFTQLLLSCATAVVAIRARYQIFARLFTSFLSCALATRKNPTLEWSQNQMSGGSSVIRAGER